MRRQTVLMTEGPIGRQLLYYALPLLLSSFLQQMYNTIDLLMVGRFGGSEAMAAVGATSYLNYLMIGFFLGLSTGATVVVAQYYGSGSFDLTQKAVHTAIALSLAGGAVLLPIGYFFSPVFLRLLGTPGDVIGQSVLYIRIYFCGVISNMVYNMGAGILRAVGDSRRPLYYLMYSMILHILVNLVLVGALHLGVVGAGVTYLISQTFSAALVWITLARSDGAYQLYFRQIHFHWDVLKRIIKIGLPAGLQSMVISVSNITMQSQINRFGSMAVAGCAAASKVNNFVYTAISAFALAITNFVGQNVGAGKFDRVKKSVWICLMMTIGVSAALGLVIWAFGRQVIGWFNSDPGVIEHGYQMVCIVGTLYWSHSFAEVFSGAVKGAGSATFAMVSSLICMCVLRILFIFGLLHYWFDIRVVFLSYPVGWISNGLCMTAYYFRGKWFERCKDLQLQKG